MRATLYEELNRLRNRHGNYETFDLDMGLEINCHKHSEYMVKQHCLCNAPREFLNDCFECITIVDLYDSISELATVPETIVRHIENNNEYLHNIINARIIEAFVDVDHHTFYCCIRGR